MHHQTISSLSHLEPYIKEILAHRTARGKKGWETILHAHPSDIADLAENIATSYRKKLFKKLPIEIFTRVFDQLSHLLQVASIEDVSQDTAEHLLRALSSDDVVDLLEHMDDERAKHYLKLMQKKQRTRIANLLTFEHDSAGGIMNSDLLTLHSDWTVKKCISLLQRLKPQTEVRYCLYVTDSKNILLGHITLDQLVLSKPDTLLHKILKKNDVLIKANEDQETAIQKMMHYDVQSAPVVDEHQHFLGVIMPDDVVEVLEEEASEDVYKMSGVGHVEHTYFETPMMVMLYERSKWLIGLLLFQSVSSIIMKRFDAMLTEHVIISLFLTMLIGTGGNAGNQSATLVIRGLATGEIGRSKRVKLFLREFGLGLMIATTLSFISFLRVYYMHGAIIAAAAISLSLFCIVLASMILGTLIPLALDRLGIDPAHSAAPFLATLMDIIGILIYCSICSYML